MYSTIITNLKSYRTTSTLEGDTPIFTDSISDALLCRDNHACFDFGSMRTLLSFLNLIPPYNMNKAEAPKQQPVITGNPQEASSMPFTRFMPYRPAIIVPDAKPSIPMLSLTSS